jgi:hypothetical protein
VYTDKQTEAIATAQIAVAAMIAWQLEAGRDEWDFVPDPTPILIAYHPEGGIANTGTF